MRELFGIFGVTSLDPMDANRELVQSTLYELTRRIAPHLRSGDALTDAAFDFLRPRFHPTYDAYIQALKTGDHVGVRAMAKALGIVDGIPPGSPWLAGGPLVRGQLGRA